MDKQQSIHAEIHDTIIHLCEMIRSENYPPQEKAQLVEATAQLIQATKDRNIF